MKRAVAGQSVAEYTMLIAAVALALGAMATYAQRAMQANLGNVEDEINPAVNETAAAPPSEDPGFGSKSNPKGLPVVRAPDFEMRGGVDDVGVGDPR